MIFACKARHSIREIPDYLLQIPLQAGVVLARVALEGVDPGQTQRHFRRPVNFLNQSNVYSD